MPNDLEAEVKKVEAKSKSERPQPPRDPTLTGGERAETPAEKNERKRRKRQPKEPPIIQKDVT
ncbi:MAG TPA: hypothetical protein VNZ22_01985 [Bacillota bacterium]|nr:hypothetical protein [Bacillota bacterium]